MPTSRVRAVLDLLTPGMVPVEIGADRAPFALGFAEKFQRRCYASEVSKGPYKALIESLNASPYGYLVSPYMADGLKDFPVDADTALICGMGGLTISRIIGEGLKGLDQLKQIILEPQSHQLEARRALIDAGFKPVREFYVAEANRFYPVIEAVRGELEKPYDDVELAYGRLSIQASDPLLVKHLQKVVASLSSCDRETLNQSSLFLLHTAEEALERMK